MTRLVVLQSNYIPWKGYFDLINDSDIFIFHDDLQYTKNDWRNRNKIKLPNGPQWLTIPVGTSEKRLICEVQILDKAWQRNHYARLVEAYSATRYYHQYQHLLDAFYLHATWTSLSELNQGFIKAIAGELGITAAFLDSRDLHPQGAKLDRLIDIIKKSGATSYISGPSARAYIDQDRFNREGIRLFWKDYSGYPQYTQRFPPFEHAVTVLDLLFNVGPEAPHYIWGWREKLSDQ